MTPRGVATLSIFGNSVGRRRRIFAGASGGCPVRSSARGRGRVGARGTDEQETITAITDGRPRALGCGDLSFMPPRLGWLSRTPSPRTRWETGGGAGRGGQATKGVWGMPWHQEAVGRGRPRKARGSCQPSVDPGVPEPTGGTETSQYPQEEKATATPSVAASERGPAQTGGDSPRGCRTAVRT